MRILKQNVLLILIMLLALLLRTWQLGSLPVGLSNDELSGVLHGYSILNSGFTMALTPWWQAILFVSPHSPTAELHGFFTIPGIALFGLNLWGARIGTAMAGVISVGLIYILILQLSKSRGYALTAALFLAISPWHIYLTRTVFDTPFGFTLILAGLCCVFSNRKVLQVLSGLFLILAFHSYIAFKLVIPLLLLVLLGYLWVTRGLNRDRIIGLLLAGVWIVIYIPLFLLFSDHSSRLAEVSSLNSSTYGVTVQKLRAESALPGVISIVLYNKYSVQLWEYVVKFFGLFSTGVLFSGDFFDIAFAVPRHGLMYLFDAVFLPVGLYFLWRRQRWLFWLFVLLGLVSMLPGVVSRVSTSYLFRSHAALISLICISAYGFYSMVMVAQLRRVMLPLSIPVLAIGVANFMLLYFSASPVRSATLFGFPDRLLHAYVEQNLDARVVVVDDNVRNFLLPYAFFEEVPVRALQDGYDSERFEYGNLVITKKCPEVGTYDVLVVSGMNTTCRIGGSESEVLYDVTKSWRVFDDRTCREASFSIFNYAPAWQNGFAEIKTLPAERLCREWFYSENIN